MLLMLLLPLQAFAAAGMVGCLFGHMPATERTATDSEMTAGCHQAAAEQAGTLEVEHQCDHCAACALASALPIPATGVVAIVPVSNGVTSRAATPFCGYVADGPERPPRPFLA
jgi:hypothetical protein